MKPMRFTADAGRHLWFWRLLALGLYGALLGLSLVWLADWGGPHGRPGLAHLAERQRESIALSVAVGLPAWLLRERMFLAVLRWQASWAAHPQTARRLWAGSLGILAAVAGLAAIWALSRARLLREGASSESMRLATCLFLAWCLYRWHHARLAIGQQLMLAAAGVLTLLVGLVLTHDKGPMLVVACGVVLLAAGWLRQTVPGGPGAALSLGVAGLGLTGLFSLLPLLAPADRFSAWTYPFAARREYLAEITWFLQAAGFWGFGPGQTPWCGYLGQAIGACQGLPKQTQSDYVLTALAGWGGVPLAVAVVAATSLWLVSLVRLAAASVRPCHGVDVAGLAASVGALYAVLSLAQLWVTCLGGVGLIPLTGVNFPLLAWARVALLNSTLALALVWPAAIGRPAGGEPIESAVSPLRTFWLAVAWAMVRLSSLAVCVVAAGLLWRLHIAAPDAMEPQRVDAVPTAPPALRANPWLPLPGCVRWSDGRPAAGLPAPGGQWTAALCGEAVAETSLPPDAPLRQALWQLAHTQPLRSESPPTGGAQGLRLPRRADVPLTLDAADQQRTQDWVDCLTARRPNACDGMNLPPGLAARYAQRAEGAAARAVVAVTLRQRDGALLAAAESRSPCSQAQMDNTEPRPLDCPPEAAKPLRRESRLAFQPIRADDMLASVVKPLLATALLQGPQGSRWMAGRPREELLSALARSDTAWFIDRLLCFADSVEPPERCTRPAVLAALVDRMALGRPLNLLADDRQGPTLGGHRPPSLVLPDIPMPLGAWPLPTGRTADLALRAARRCHARPTDERWRGCDTEALQAVVAPLWGQGAVRSHPLAVAGLYLRLVAAAQGRAAAPLPHLLPTASPTAPTGFSSAQAQLVLQGLRLTPLQGTALGACQGVFGAPGCKGLGWALKTGTSLFPQHTLTVQQRAAVCQRAHRALAEGEAADRSPELLRLAVNCSLYPMKWAVAIENPDSPDPRLTVVLAERNWEASSGRLDAGDDRAPNVAAEAALLLHAARVERE